MSFKLLPFSSFILNITLCFSLIFSFSHIRAANFEIQNNCTYTVWAAAVPGGGRELRQGQSWLVNSDPNYGERGRIWARTNCNFDDTGIGKCETGDCDGTLYCVSNGKTPTTLAEYGKTNNVDFFDMSLMLGFNVPMEFKSTSTECTKEIKCTADINRLCPTEIRDPGGCNHPCTVFKNDQFCCLADLSNCGPTAYSKFFKDLCPNVYTHPMDDATSLFSCPSGTEYKVVFCP